MASTMLTLQRPEGEFTAQLYGVGQSGPLVVCLHGFPDLPGTWRLLVPCLVAEGFRVLVPFMRGYEPGTVQERGEYHVARLVDDLLAWIDHLGERQVFLVGHDWGAVTGWAAIARAAHRFRAYCALAIPHLGGFAGGLLRHPVQWRRSWYMSFFQVPGVPEHLLSRPGGSVVDMLWRQWSPGWNVPRDHVDAVAAALATPGIREAALGYYRCLFKPWQAPNRELLMTIGPAPRVPVLALAGRQDGCIDPALFDDCMRAVAAPGLVEHALIDGVGHFLHLESPDDIHHRIMTFFRRF